MPIISLRHYVNINKIRGKAETYQRDQTLRTNVQENTMLEIETLKNQVRHNCDITDSQHAGLYSICGLAMRLRDLYKWEKGLEPWIEKDSAEILEWIEAKEQTWDALTDNKFKEINILGRKYDPFDVEGINPLIEPHGFLYGGGLARGLKPTFFLAAIKEKKLINGYPVYILGRELARDLLTLPALTQGNSILIRQEAAKLYLWDQIFYIKKSGRKALNFALEHYGLQNQNPQTLHANLKKIVAAETDTYIYHELGELQDTVLDRDIWRRVIAAFPHTVIEFLARTVKDLLADTNEYGTLRHIISQRKAASLAFYVAFLEGLLKEMFPEIIEAFQNFMNTHNWEAVEQAVADGYQTAKYYSHTISAIFQEGRQKYDNKWIENEMAVRLLRPLGVT